MNPIVAMAHVVVILSNIRRPRWHSAAAMAKEGIRNAAIAEPATLGYASVHGVNIISILGIQAATNP